MHEPDSIRKQNKNQPDVPTFDLKKNGLYVNGEACRHPHFDGLLIKIEDGCIMRCADCKMLIVKHCPCVTDETLEDKDIQGLMPCAYWRGRVFH